MKFKLIYTFFALTMCLVVFTSSKDGRANAANEGNTGAPGDQVIPGPDNNPWVCATCHQGNAIEVTQTFEITDMDGNDVSSVGYTPGADHIVRLTVNPVSGGPEAFGFQMLCLNAPAGMDGSEVSDWAVTSGSNVQIATASNTNRTYVEHDGPSSSNVFEMTWTAPASGSGEVTFYAASNGVNLNNMATGDGATNGQYSLIENDISNVRHTQLDATIQLFPNPVETELTISVQTGESGLYQWRIIDQLGRTLQAGEQDLPQGHSQVPLTLNDFAAGLYHFQLLKDGKTATELLIKK